MGLVQDVWVYIHAYTHTHTHTYMHTYMHACIRTYVLGLEYVSGLGRGLVSLPPSLSLSLSLSLCLPPAPLSLPPSLPLSLSLSLPSLPLCSLLAVFLFLSPLINDVEIKF